MTNALGFWGNLKNAEQPFVGLSPMDGITDVAFRAITGKYGKPDLIFTEFIAVEALIRGVGRSFEDLRYKENERPIVAQLYGKDPELFYSCAQIIAELGFDGIDINMGCPAKSVEQRGAGAGLIRTPEIASEIIKAVQSGLSGWVKNGIEYNKWPVGIKSSKVKRFFKEEFKEGTQEKNVARTMIPISIKTRIGYDKPIIDEWFTFLANTGVKVFTIHGRTLRQQYSGLADWEQIEKAAEVIRKIQPNALVIGNGDIHSYAEAIAKVKKYKVDGALIGRSSIGNPWIFNRESFKQSELLTTMQEHADLHYKLKPVKSFVQMRRILSEYVKQVKGAKELRTQLVHVNNPQDVEKILNSIDKLQFVQ